MPKFEPRHEWNVPPQEAMEIQDRLRQEMVLDDQLGPVRFVAGVDAGFEQEGTVTRAAVALLTFPELTLHEYAIARRPTTFPYVAGLLSFREAPTVLDALERLRTTPDLLLCDGQGMIHPRRFGIACHLGVLTNLPSIGVAKSWFIGQHEALPEERGAWQPLTDRGELIGAVLRSRAGTKPLYISQGHRISLQSALDYVMACTTQYRLPETTRWAHRLASGPAPE